MRKVLYKCGKDVGGYNGRLPNHPKGSLIEAKVLTEGMDDTALLYVFLDGKDENDFICVCRKDLLAPAGAPELEVWKEIIAPRENFMNVSRDDFVDEMSKSIRFLEETYRWGEQG